MRFEDFIHNEMGSNKKDKPAKQKRKIYVLYAVAK